MNYKTKKNMNLRHCLSIPFIYMIVFPMLFLDFFTEIYNQIVFRLYGLPVVDRSHYIKLDRHKLPYLNWVQKINCAYCGYANGFAAFLVEVFGQTENYWCGIKHQERDGFSEPKNHKCFVDYGDKSQFEDKYYKNN